MMAGWKKMDRMKASLRIRTNLVHPALILIILFRLNPSPRRSEYPA